MTRKYRIDYEEQHLHEPRIYWHLGDPPPPWQPPARKAAFEKYRWAMIDFVEGHLFDRSPDPDFKPNTDDRWLTEWYENRGPEIEAAERGDIEPLRRKYPHLAEFLHVPERKRKRGEHITHGESLSERAHRAADMVPKVRAIWEKHYGKKVRRSRPTTEEIVANIFGVEVRHVKLQLSREKAERHQNKKQKRETVSS